MANVKALQLTDTDIRSLQKPEAKKWVRDGGGLALCLTPAKRGPWRFWYYIYTSPETGKKVYKPLGSYPDVSLKDARNKVIELAASIRRKVDPVAEERREMAAKLKGEAEERRQKEADEKMMNVEGLVDKYLREYAMVKKTSWTEDARILKKDILPRWSGRKARDITRQDVLELVDGMKGRGPGIVHNTYKILRKMFNFAVKREIIQATPCYGFEKGDELPLTSTKERNLSEEEIRLFWNGINNCAMSESTRRILKLILLTGQRVSEIASIHRQDIIDRWWEFTPKETSVTKVFQRKQRIYLTDTALNLIGDGQGFIFSSPRKDDDNQPTKYIKHRSISCALRRNLITHKVNSRPATWKKNIANKQKRKTPFTIHDENKLYIEKFTPHDLRRTCATMISQLGYSDEIVDAILAHLKKGVIRIYNKNKYDHEKQEALTRWEQKLLSVINKID